MLNQNALLLPFFVVVQFMQTARAASARTKVAQAYVTLTSNYYSDM
jgi:hypothetical protein